LTATSLIASVLIFPLKTFKYPAIKNVAVERLLSSKTMLFLGLGMIVSVPIFKTITH